MNGPPPQTQPTKRERWELRQQEKTAERAHHAKQRTQKTMTRWGIGVVVALVVMVGWWKLASQPAPNGNPSQPTEITSDDWIKGNMAAPVTLLEFSDFQCPACASYYPVVKQLLEAYPETLRVAYRHYPLTRIHANAIPAAQAAEAAGRQGKFWEMHDRLFEQQERWAKAGNAEELFAGYAQELGLDVTKFRADLADPAVRQKINRHQDSGTQLRVQGTPTFFLNGKTISSPASLEEFKQLVDAALTAAPLPSPSATENFHAHADLMVYVNGKPLDLSPAKYQSTKEKELDPDTHLHAGNGKIVHLHKRGVTLAQFFKSLGMELAAACLQLDDGKKYCTDGTKSLKLDVNGEAISDQFSDYQPQDLDRILISYGSETQTQLNKQLDSVTDEACIYSETCPERGKPPTEECVGGLGTGCDE